MTLQVDTRQTPKGAFWCNTTHIGYDLYEEGQTIEEARQLITKTLSARGVMPDEIKWSESIFYKHSTPVVKSDIGYRSWRIDKGMV